MILKKNDKLTFSKNDYEQSFSLFHLKNVITIKIIFYLSVIYVCKKNLQLNFNVKLKLFCYDFCYYFLDTLLISNI